MLHLNATVDADKQGDKARFKRLACQEHKAERKSSVFPVPSVAKKSVKSALIRGHFQQKMIVI